MTYARTLTLASSADPIHAAIERHRTAYDAFQIAPEGEASIIANDEYDAATDALAITPCATRFGALALLGHLRWWLAEEADFSAGHQPGYGIAQARAADLTLFLGTSLPPVTIGLAMSSGRIAAPVPRCSLSDPPRAGELANFLEILTCPTLRMPRLGAPVCPTTPLTPSSL